MTVRDKIQCHFVHKREREPRSMDIPGLPCSESICKVVQLTLIASLVGPPDVT